MQSTIRIFKLSYTSWLGSVFKTFACHIRHHKLTPTAGISSPIHIYKEGAYTRPIANSTVVEYSIKMATTRKEPEYMELTKETRDKEPPHIYELDIPKVPQSTDQAEDKKDQAPLQYHYVKNTDTRGIKAPPPPPPAAVAPSEPVEKEEEKKEQHQYHYIEGGGEVTRVRPLSKLASQEVRSKIKETLEEKIRDRDRQRKCSVKCVVFTVLFILTVLNTLMATAALAIGAILYPRVHSIQMQINGTYTHVNT